MEIKNSVQNLVRLPFKKLLPFQNQMKILTDENYQKLKREIMETGFSFAIHCWENPQDRNLYILDGHQRHEALIRMNQEGIVNDDQQVPVAIVEAKSFAEAKRKCLAGASQYGQFDLNGVVKTLSDAQITNIQAAAMFDFPKIDMILNRELEYQEATKEPGEKDSISPEEEFTVEVDEKNDYILLYFDNKNDFKKASEILGLKTQVCELSASPETSTMPCRGIGRVLPWEKVKGLFNA